MMDGLVDLLFSISVQAGQHHRAKAKKVVHGKNKTRQGEENKLIDDAVNAGMEPSEAAPSRHADPKGIAPGRWVPGSNDQMDPTGRATQQIG